jgi:hypothetical protein
LYVGFSLRFVVEGWVRWLLLVMAACLLLKQTYYYI